MPIVDHHHHNVSTYHSPTPHVSTHDGFNCNISGSIHACNQGMPGAIASGAVSGGMAGVMADGVGVVPGAIVGGAAGGLSNCIGNVTNHLSGCM